MAVLEPHAVDHGTYASVEGRTRALALLLVHAAACSAGDEGMRAPPVTAAAAGGNAGTPGQAGMNASGAGATAGAVGSAGRSAGGAGGRSGAAGRGGGAGMAMGTGGMAGAPLPDPNGVAPDQIVLSTVAANASVGLDWSRVQGATGYRVFFANASGVAPTSGQSVDVADPAYVHRGLQNGMTYYYVVCAVLSGTLGPPSKEASAQPGGEWVLEQLGTGDFDNVLDGQRVPRVPIDKRVQVLLFAEGYLETDLPVFHSDATHASRGNDVDRWIDEVFAMEPYARMRDGFVVWYLPRASAARVGAGDTAFHVTVSSGSVTEIDAAAAPLWSAIDTEGSDKFAFAPGTNQPTQLVAAFMVFDAQRGRGGLSGMTGGLRNPAGNQTIRAAFALGYAHEFTHAFASVGDEYMEVSGRLPRVGETNNLAPANRCDELPWAHLLEGRGLNTTAGLVGAFGTPELGYHSELRCQMNGTHENGQIFCKMGDERYGNLLLRSDHLCNFCREVTTYRIFERTGLLSGSTGFATWKAMYRPAFFNRFGFFVPPGPLPQTLDCNRNLSAPIYQACVP